MKYSEFKAEVEGLGFNVKHFSQSVYVENQEKEIIAKVDLHSRYMLSTHTNSFFRLDEMVAFKIYELCMMLAETPLAEREEEKRYRLLSVSPMLRKNECGYLLYHREYDKYYTGNTDHWGLVYQTIFTESEIAEMDITGFEKIRVME